MHGKWAIKSRGGRFKPEEADKLTCPYVGAGELKEGEGGGIILGSGGKGVELNLVNVGACQGREVRGGDVDAGWGWG